MKNYILILGLLSFVHCSTPSINEIEKDKTKAMKYLKTAYSGLQFSDFHRVYSDSALLYYPDSFGMFQVYSYSYKKTGEHIKAMELLNKAVELNPREALGYRAWSMLYYYRNYEKTIEDVDSLFSLTNSCMEVCWGEPCKYQRFLALYKLERYEEALNEMEELIQCENEYGLSTEDNYNYNFYIARAYQKLNNYKKSLHYFDRLLKKESSIMAEYLYYKALVHIAREDQATANDLLQLSLAQAKKGYTFSDPYIELPDKVYVWMIEDLIKANSKDKLKK